MKFKRNAKQYSQDEKTDDKYKRYNKLLYSSEWQKTHLVILAADYEPNESTKAKSFGKVRISF